MVYNSTFENSPWQLIATNVRLGLGEKLYPVGSIKRGQIRNVIFDFIVLDHNRDSYNSMTVWARPIKAEGSLKSVWSTSSGANRAYSSSTCSARTKMESFFSDAALKASCNSNAPTPDILLTVQKMCWSSGTTYGAYSCKFFIPSDTEIYGNVSSLILNSALGTPYYGSDGAYEYFKTGVTICTRNPYLYFYTNLNDDITGLIRNGGLTPAKTSFTYWTRTPTDNANGMTVIASSTGLEDASSYSSQNYIAPFFVVG